MVGALGCRKKRAHALMWSRPSFLSSSLQVSSLTGAHVSLLALLSSLHRPLPPPPTRSASLGLAAPTADRRRRRWQNSRLFSTTLAAHSSAFPTRMTARLHLSRASRPLEQTNSADRRRVLAPSRPPHEQ
jgi:hypothetical protein